jgi:hypothetical protein
MGADDSGHGEQHGHGAGVVVGPRRARDRIIMGTDQYPGPPRIADDDTSLIVFLDARPVEPGVGEPVDDLPSDDLVLGGPIDARHG